jgi:hypothetical protein
MAVVFELVVDFGAAMDAAHRARDLVLAAQPIDVGGRFSAAAQRATHAISPSSFSHQPMGSTPAAGSAMAPVATT